MTNTNTHDLRALFVSMAEAHEKKIEQLTEWKNRGVQIGPTTIEEIIEREDKAAKGLRQAIANIDAMSKS